MKILSFLFPNWFHPFDKEFVQILGYVPGKFDLFQQALTHKSYSSNNNERLEYLGDAVLETMVAEYLYHHFENYTEGQLTQLKSHLVSRKNLNEIGLKLGLDKFIQSSIKENKLSENIVGNTLEALIGAIYLDNTRQAKIFIERQVLSNIPSLNEDSNYKGKLLEWCAQSSKEVLFNTIQLENSLLFQCQLLLENQTIGLGKGKNKKEAEQCAAEAALANLNISLV